MKKIIVGLSLVVLLLVSITGNTYATGSMSLQTAKSEFSKNEKFVVNATISGVTTNKGVGVMMATLKYDESSLVLEEINGQNGWELSSYKGIIIAEKESDITNNEIVFKMTFSVKENANSDFYVALKEITVSGGVKDIELANTVRNFTMQKEPDIDEGNGDHNNQDDNNNNENDNTNNDNVNNGSNNNNNNANNGNNNNVNNVPNGGNAGSTNNNKPSAGTNNKPNSKPNNGNNIVSSNNEIDNNVNEIENNVNEILENNTVNENVENTVQNKINNSSASDNKQEDYSKIFLITLGISASAVVITLVYSGIKNGKKKKSRVNYYSSNVNYNNMNEFDASDPVDNSNYSEDANSFDNNTLNNSEEFSSMNNSHSEGTKNTFNNSDFHNNNPWDNK